MTMPHLMNCKHLPDGWCLECVADLHAAAEADRELLGDLLGLIDRDGPRADLVDATRRAGWRVYADRARLEAALGALREIEDMRRGSVCESGPTASIVGRMAARAIAALAEDGRVGHGYSQESAAGVARLGTVPDA